MTLYMYIYRYMTLNRSIQLYKYIGLYMIIYICIHVTTLCPDFDIALHHVIHVCITSDVCTCILYRCICFTSVTSTSLNLDSRLHGRYYILYYQYVIDLDQIYIVSISHLYHVCILYAWKYQGLCSLSSASSSLWLWPLWLFARFELWWP